MPTYTNTSKFLKSLSAALALVFAVVLSLPNTVQAQLVSTDKALEEMSIGDPNAPVVLHEYSSLTCGHCANFHTKSLPELKKKYVETGKVRIVFHDFPLEPRAVAAVALSRCAGSPRNVEFFDMLYDTQESWARSEQFIAKLTALARFFGLSADDVITCLSDEKLMTTIQKNRDRDSATFGIKSTPSFILEGKLIEGALSADDMGDLLDKARAKKGMK